MQNEGQVPRASVTVSRKISTGDYESTDIHATFSVDLDPLKENPVKTIDALYTMLEEFVGEKEKQVRMALGDPKPTLHEKLLKLVEKQKKLGHLP